MGVILAATRITMDRGALARFGEVMRRKSWFTRHVAQALVGWATQST